MPDTSDPLKGLEPFIRLDHVPGHPEGEFRLWVKNQFFVMTIAQTRSLGDHLHAAADRIEGLSQPEAPAVEEPAPQPNGIAEPEHAGAE